MGPIEQQVRADVGALMTAHPMGESLAEMAYGLARTLDAGAGMATAAVNKELRLTLDDLRRLGVTDDDNFEAELSAPVRDPEER